MVADHSAVRTMHTVSAPGTCVPERVERERAAMRLLSQRTAINQKAPLADLWALNCRSWSQR
jgi:hypothetical protein